MATSSQTSAMVATSFPRFLELPRELQIIIWEQAISPIVLDGPSWNDSMRFIRCFHSKLWHRLNPIHGFYENGETAPPRMGPKRGQELPVAKNWHATSWVGLLNTCLISRLLVLKWMREMAKKTTDRHDTDRRKRLLLVVNEMIEDIDARLRHWASPYSPASTLMFFQRLRRRTIAHFYTHRTETLLPVVGWEDDCGT